jgi:NADH:ubiquinone oxidoreductase subunit E
MGERLGVKETFLQAIIRRIPSLRLDGTHCLELCGGPNCSKRAALADFVEKTWGKAPKSFRLRYVPCMRMCGKGPNLRWDGKVYNGADEALVRKLIREAESDG